MIFNGGNIVYIPYDFSVLTSDELFKYIDSKLFDADLLLEDEIKHELYRISEGHPLLIMALIQEMKYEKFSPTKILHSITEKEKEILCYKYFYHFLYDKSDYELILKLIDEFEVKETNSDGYKFFSAKENLGLYKSIIDDYRIGFKSVILFTESPTYLYSIVKFLLYLLSKEDRLYDSLSIIFEVISKREWEKCFGLLRMLKNKKEQYFLINIIAYKLLENNYPNSDIELFLNKVKSLSNKRYKKSGFFAWINLLFLEKGYDSFINFDIESDDQYLTIAELYVNNKQYDLASDLFVEINPNHNLINRYIDLGLDIALNITDTKLQRSIYIRLKEAIENNTSTYEISTKLLKLYIKLQETGFVSVLDIIISPIKKYIAERRSLVHRFYFNDYLSDRISLINKIKSSSTKTELIVEFIRALNSIEYEEDGAFGIVYIINNLKHLSKSDLILDFLKKAQESLEYAKFIEIKMIFLIGTYISMLYFDYGYEDYSKRLYDNLREFFNSEKVYYSIFDELGLFSNEFSDNLKNGRATTFLDKFLDIIEDDKDDIYKDFKRYDIYYRIALLYPCKKSIERVLKYIRKGYPYEITCHQINNIAIIISDCNNIDKGYYFEKIAEYTKLIGDGFYTEISIKNLIYHLNKNLNEINPKQIKKIIDIVLESAIEAPEIDFGYYPNYFIMSNVINYLFDFDSFSVEDYLKKILKCIDYNKNVSQKASFMLDLSYMLLKNCGDISKITDVFSQSINYFNIDKKNFYLEIFIQKILEKSELSDIFYKEILEFFRSISDAEKNIFFYINYNILKSNTNNRLLLDIYLENLKIIYPYFDIDSILENFIEDISIIPEIDKQFYYSKLLELVSDIDEVKEENINLIKEYQNNLNDHPSNKNIIKDNGSIVLQNSVKTLKYAKRLLMKLGKTLDLNEELFINVDNIEYAENPEDNINTAKSLFEKAIYLSPLVYYQEYNTYLFNVIFRQISRSYGRNKEELIYKYIDTLVKLCIKNPPKPIISALGMFVSKVYKIKHVNIKNIYQKLIDVSYNIYYSENLSDLLMAMIESIEKSKISHKLDLFLQIEKLTDLIQDVGSRFNLSVNLAKSLDKNGDHDKAKEILYQLINESEYYFYVKQYILDKEKNNEVDNYDELEKTISNLVNKIGYLDLDRSVKLIKIIKNKLNINLNSEFLTLLMENKRYKSYISLRHNYIYFNEICHDLKFIIIDDELHKKDKSKIISEIITNINQLYSYKYHMMNKKQIIYFIIEILDHIEPKSMKEKTLKLIQKFVLL